MDPRLCPTWFAAVLGHRLRRLFHNPEKILGGMIAPGQFVADLGCGPGFFSIPMARLVGDNGCVVAADVQQPMLDMVHRQAVRLGLQPRIRLHLSSMEKIGIGEKVDFVLAFWMVHEVENKEAFLREVLALLKPQASFLFVEPTVHVNALEFEDTVSLARRVGFLQHSRPRIALSRAVLFKNE